MSSTRRLAASVVAAAVAATTPLALAPQVAAFPVVLDPSDPQVAQQWVNPYIRAEDKASPLRVEIAPLEQSHWDPLRPLSVQISITNTSDSPITDASLKLFRGDATTDPEHAATMMTVGLEAYPYSLTGEEDLSIGAGEKREITLTVTPGASADRIRPGVYPFLVWAGATADSGAISTTERFLMPTDPIRPAPALVDDTPQEMSPPDSQEPDGPSGLTMLLPITAPADITPGETGEAPTQPTLYLRDDELATTIVSGGRLDQLLDTYIERTADDAALKESTCLAVDPQLLSAVDRMSDGYRVSDTRPSPVAPAARLRDRWDTPSEESLSEAGSSTVVAGEWIAKLHRATENSCVVALPWANADVNAVAATGNQWLAREAVTRGRMTVEEILGRPVSSQVVIPTAGYMTQRAESVVHTASSDLTPDEAWTRQRQQSRQHNHYDHAPDVLTQDEAPQEERIPDSSLGQAEVLLADSAPAPSGEGVKAVGYNSGLASMVARMGSAPVTTAYSDPRYRFDYTLDSATARRQSASAALELAALNAQKASEPLLVLPPAQISSGDADALFDSAHFVLNKRISAPMDIADYVDTAAAPSGTRDVVDPAAMSDREIITTSQQLRYTDEVTRLMVRDANIALTPYGFSAPLRQDILRALSRTERDTLRRHTAATERADRIIKGNRAMLMELRDAVALLPPGNVYTRTSSSSPLLIVARNGLPLPVDSHIGYSAPHKVKLELPEQLRIPAKGSITTELTARIPEDDQRTDLELFLLTPTDTLISNPVDISVQTRGTTINRWLAGVLLALLVGLMALRTVKRRRARSTQQPRTAADRALARAEAVSAAESQQRAHRRDAGGWGSEKASTRAQYPPRRHTHHRDGPSDGDDPPRPRRSRQRRPRRNPPPETPGEGTRSSRRSRDS
ncbi:hypothetical protein CCICO_11460 [Corynebacterium ciconiae DSM 44920]|uniref:hypothetical protein n=1 Tax=Corynebacterium ciconiae TaxID=227319 RepID=UPI000376B377|nr:hypothetical protein [Corynebacterium ciconiae]WKD62283.1 hypothetical protein CCICO_11460 [Corynebacterium ciconiae DSM 44920]